MGIHAWALRHNALLRILIARDPQAAGCACQLEHHWKQAGLYREVHPTLE
jgi:hypothetical protein